jgi:aminomethyltransferase
MPVPTPFFPRTSALCHSMKYKEWAGYYAVSSYEVHHDSEYYAFRNSAGLLDVTPLFKYHVSGPDAARFLSRIMVRDISKLGIGKVSYCCWCDDHGKVIDDGTVMRRGENEFFVTSADPCYSWFARFLRGYKVELEEISEQYAALALQGPTSRDILRHICDANLDTLKFFTTRKTRCDGFDMWISRTGYTGDLGYELWIENKDALKLYDALTEAGRNYDLRPAGLDALDVTRNEAGLILKDVDYYNALHALIDDRKSSPYEISLGWTVDLERDPFNGQAALKREKQNGSVWAIVGLDIDWPQLEALYNKCGLPAAIGTHAWRSSAPIYSARDKKQQVGYATSGTWSPLLKKNIALGTVRNAHSQLGGELQFEVTIEHKRHTVSAIVSKPQFFNPERKTSNPNSTKA